MGLFSIIKMIREEKKKAQSYLNMHIVELNTLTDEELFDALQTRISSEEGNMDVSECLEHFKDAKRIFYIVNYFDMEVQNGGLCQFFVNSSRMVAPYIIECLDAIEAASYKKLLSNFVNEHRISMDHLESFMIEDIDEYEDQVNRYPFDDFDDAYYELYEKEPLQGYLIKYARKHIREFKI